ncbi:VOC family protein [Alteromonas oceanisediminis]|uniref:VOC family protein n=1 Tax=Alteromonas oceanisediminis TaxID=2836180 RepID=UPI001BDA8506|nr:VOC family protein [Alteromonas oceanisediminis]MBT0586307.1 VOC family protein [Alteromonas oceanisediminis]
MNDSKIGQMGWIDLTVDNADEIKDFYASVVGWSTQRVEMDGYNDYSMQMPVSGKDVAGICHRKGSNAELPAKWLPYFIVQDIEHALANVVARNGKTLSDIRTYGNSKFVIIEDPAGAVCALYQE